MVLIWISLKAGWAASPARSTFPGLDQSPESWEVGYIKTTLDLPADLVREMKLRVAREGRKLKDVVTEVVRRGLARSGSVEGGVVHRVKLPLIKCRPPEEPAAGLTPDQVAETLLQQEVAWSDEAARRYSLLALAISGHSHHAVAKRWLEEEDSPSSLYICRTTQQGPVRCEKKNSQSPPRALGALGEIEGGRMKTPPFTRGAERVS